MTTRSRLVWGGCAAVLGLALVGGAVLAFDGPEKSDETPRTTETPKTTEALVGQPAPEFTLKVLDGEGRTREVSKADLAGKVVMIDFWATWCPPCLRELPEVAKMIEEFDKDPAKKGKVAIVALSVDQDPEEFSEVRKLVEKTLDAKDIPTSGSKVSLVAIDAKDRSIAKDFAVRAIPTVVLLDGKGVVQGVHLGYREDVRKVLTRDIETLLAGKPLPRTEEDKTADNKE